MTKFTMDEVSKVMRRPEQIRNISVIAHVDHGKSTLTDSLVSKAGIIAKQAAGTKVVMDTLAIEQEKGITIKSTAVTLLYERQEDTGSGSSGTVPYLVNLVDTPGHVDFSSEVTAALRVTDGALVVVDCVEGVCVQTETVLRQAISERIQPVLFLNKLDRIFLELDLPLEESYARLRQSIESVNVICATYRDSALGEVSLLPQSGNVGFGSGLQAWGFTLRDFARMYGTKFGVSEDKLMHKLWGEHYWDGVRRCWVGKQKQKQKQKGQLMRGFCQFVLHPIRALTMAIMSGKKEEYLPIIAALQLDVGKKQLEKASKRNRDLLKLVIRTWLPAGDAMLDMIAEHLPSPVRAQEYRVEKLYSGALDSECAMAVRRCDRSGPLGMYVSKMVPFGVSGRFVAFGRVFSGTVRTGSEVRVVGQRGVGVRKVQGTLVMMGPRNEKVDSVPAGNVCGLVGVDEFLVKAGTVSDCAQFEPFVSMNFSVAAVVQRSVDVKSAKDLPRLVEGLKKLAKSDQLVKTFTNKTGQHVVAGAGELHLEVCLRSLREDWMKDAEIVVSDPVVPLAESVAHRTGDNGKFPKTCVAKSANKLNRMMVWAQPLAQDLVAALEEGRVCMGSDAKALGKSLKENGWSGEERDARKVWSFGCAGDGVANLLVDRTRGVQYVKEVKEHVVGMFSQVTQAGVLCGEAMRGVEFCVEDMKIHSDSAHRGAGQMMPCARKAFYACQIASGPRLLEPVYLVDITVPRCEHSGVYKTLNSKRGEVQGITDRVGTPLTQVKAFLPVLKSFGFTELLRKNTGGKAFPQMRFAKWQVYGGHPLQAGTQANQMLLETRKRKGMKVAAPVFTDYFDRI